jgi:hypothetical protein
MKSSLVGSEYTKKAVSYQPLAEQKAFSYKKAFSY